MMTQDELRQQISQYISDKQMTEDEKVAFLVMAVGMVRERIVQEIQKALTDEDFTQAEETGGSDEEVFSKMVKSWEKRTGKTKEELVKNLTLELLEKFLETKDQPVPSTPLQA